MCIYDKRDLLIFLVNFSIFEFGGCAYTEQEKVLNPKSKTIV